MFAIAAIEEEAGQRKLRGDLWDPNRWPWIFRPIVKYENFKLVVNKQNWKINTGVKFVFFTGL